VQVRVADAARLDADQRLTGSRVGHDDGLDGNRRTLRAGDDAVDLVWHAGVSQIPREIERGPPPIGVRPTVADHITTSSAEPPTSRRNVAIECRWAPRPTASPISAPNQPR